MITIADILSIQTAAGAPLFSPADAAAVERMQFRSVDDILLTPEQAARFLDIGASTLRAWRKDGRVRAVYLPHNARPLFRLGDLRGIERPRIGRPSWIRKEIMDEIVTYNLRTGTHRYPVVEMPDGRQRAVWQVFNGPTFVGFFTKTIGGKVERTTQADYEAYCARLRSQRSGA